MHCTSFGSSFKSDPVSCDAKKNFSALNQGGEPGSPEVFPQLPVLPN